MTETKKREGETLKVLDVMRRYHGEYGVPPAGFFRRLLWRIRGRA